MSLSKFTWSLLALMLIGWQGFAQTGEKTEANDESSARLQLDLLEKGDKHYARGQYLQALEFYQYADTLSEEKDPVVQKRIGVTLFKAERYQEALPLMEKSIKRLDTLDIYLQYFHAVAAHQLGKYDLAASGYERCLDYIEEKQLESGWDEVGKRLAQCRFWQKISGEQLPVRIRRLDSTINSPEPDYGPRITDDGRAILFTRRRKRTHVISSLLAKPDEEIYVSRFDSGRWSAATPMADVNDQLNNAFLGFSHDGNQVFLFNDENQGDIAIAELDSLHIGKPLPVPGAINSVDFNENNITVTNNGNVAYFISDRTDLNHQGGKDIYSAIWDPVKGWKEIKNMGPAINSPYDEDFVFWSKEEKTLYFSSNRENSIGGYDIFFAKVGDDGRFLAPENLGLPVNTPYNDISFYKKGDKAWYATHFPGNREDIFEIDFGPEKLDPHWYRQPVAGIKRLNDFVKIDHVYFHSGQRQVNSGDPLVKELARNLKNTRGVKIRLSGHSDWVGEQRTNDQISFERAVSVASELVRQGVDPKILSLDFHGEQELLTDTAEASNLQAQQLNRCVRITVEQQGTPYLYVQSDQQQDPFETSEDALKVKQFFVMLYVSKEPVRKFDRDPEVKLGYDDETQVQYYYVGPFSEPMQAFEALKLQLENNEKAYVYYQEMRIDDAMEVQVTIE